MDISHWHSRYQQQAGWTSQVRDYLFHKASHSGINRSLDVGCGTGVLLKEFGERGIFECYGVDISPESLSYAKTFCPQAQLVQADAHTLPFSNCFFDLTVCHFLLLWTVDPLRVVSEMTRVTRPGGHIFVLAEPDYGGRMDFPASQSELARWQIESLKQQGADPYIGRRLIHLFKSNGLSTMGGIVGAQWSKESLQDQRGSSGLEWEVIKSDLDKLEPPLPPEQITRFQREYEQAHDAGEKFLFIPTVYAWSQVP